MDAPGQSRAFVRVRDRTFARKDVAVMASLMELVERVNKGEMVDASSLEMYQESPNSAEKFLAHHAHAMLDLRRAQQHMLQSLEAIDYSDQKVLNQFVSVSGFLGLTDLRAAPVIKFGACAIARREYALGLEAIQNGVSYDLAHGGAYTSDRENCLFVAAQYERAAQWIGWRADDSGEWNNKQTKIAYVTSAIADDEQSARTVASLARHYDQKRFKLQVYSTEAAVRRDKQQFAPTVLAQPSAKRGCVTLDLLSKHKVAPWMAPVDGDSVSAARELAGQLVRDKIDVAIFDTSQADPIAAVVANWQVARVKMNLCRRAPLYMAGIDCVAYFDQARWESDKVFCHARGVDSRHVMEGIDVEDDLGIPPQRSAYGIPDNAVVLATAGHDLDRTMSDEFVETMINILRAHPHAVYLLIGEAELASQKRRFESAGVAKRIGYTGKRKDLPGFLRLADLYLAEFPGSGASGVLQAMSVERPVVAMRWGDEIEQSQAATFAGSECTISGRDGGAYIERVSKIIREPAYRAKLGKVMKQRIGQHFGFNQTARALEQLCDQLIQQRSEALAEDRDTISQAA
jgi:predicted O-linked N-acetylglucosamine transferase (SPINDLY family)